MVRPIAALCTLLLLAPPALACRTPAGAEGLRSQVVAGVNAERRAAGLAALSPDAALMRVAQDQACDNAAADALSHQGADGARLATRIKRTGYRFRVANENVGRGMKGAESAVGWWMNSPPHRHNILERGSRDIGVGIAVAAGGALHWTMVTGARK
jgi:uncharacterized protein YkwD